MTSGKSSTRGPQRGTSDAVLVEVRCTAADAVPARRQGPKRSGEGKPRGRTTEQNCRAIQTPSRKNKRWEYWDGNVRHRHWLGARHSAARSAEALPTQGAPGSDQRPRRRSIATQSRKHSERSKGKTTPSSLVLIWDLTKEGRTRQARGRRRSTDLSGRFDISTCKSGY